jgi:hypothetical protein
MRTRLLCLTALATALSTAAVLGYSAPAADAHGCSRVAQRPSVFEGGVRGRGLIDCSSGSGPVAYRVCLQRWFNIFQGWDDVTCRADTVTLGSLSYVFHTQTVLCGLGTIDYRWRSRFKMTHHKVFDWSTSGEANC